MALVYFVKIVHFASAAVWFGHKLLIPADLQRSVAAGGEVARALVPRIERAERVGIASGLLTLASGVALVLVTGGFGAMPWRIHLGLALVVVMFAVGATVARPAWRRVREGIERGDTGEAAAGVARVNTAFVVEQILWMVVLVLMVVKW